MGKDVKIKLNNLDLSVDSEQTILEIAQEYGISIPTFCHDERLEPDGGCRMCIVEINGQDKLFTSCTTFPQEGMNIKTESPKVVKTRRQILELLWAGHPNDCVVCDANGDCLLQDYSYRYDVSSDPLYSGYKRSFAIDDTNKFFKIDPDKCILCGRCVRVCDQLQGVHALDIYERGVVTFVSFTHNDVDDVFNCVSCGNCVSICPTGALQEKNANKFRMWETTKVRTTCSYCGVGCQMDLVLKDEKVVRIEPVLDGPNEGLLCVKGKFAYKYINHKDRLKTPLIKENGVFREASWDEAYDLITLKANEYLKSSGPYAFAGLASAKCTNEENYMFQKLFRGVIGTNNIDHCARLCHASTVEGLATTLGSGAMTNSIAEVKENDVIFIIGSNTTETHPVIGSFMKQAKRNGAKIIVAEPRKINLAEYADVFIQIKPGTNVALLNAIMHVIYKENLHDKEFIKNRTQGFDEFIKNIENFTPEDAAEICECDPQLIEKAARIFGQSPNAGIYYAMGVTQHSQGTNHVKSVANLALITGNLGKNAAGVNPLRGQNNVQGACDMGGLPDVLPGYQKVFNNEAREKFEKHWGVKLNKNVGLSIPHIINGAYNDLIKFLYIMGENPVVSDPDSTHVKEALEAVEFLVVQDIFLTETAQYADVVLPATSFAEKDGTFTNTERRVQRVRKAINPIGNSKPDYEIIIDLMNRLGYKQAMLKPNEIMDEIASLTPIYAGIDYNRIDNIGLQWPVKDKNHQGTKFLYEGNFSKGPAKFTPISHINSAEMPDKEYPLILTTGRVLYHFHTITMTGKNEEIRQIVPVNFIEIHPETAKKYLLRDKDTVSVSSRRGTTSAEVHITEKMAKGSIFMPFHFADGANLLTNDALDEACNIPELKVCAVKIDGVL